MHRRTVAFVASAAHAANAGAELEVVQTSSPSDHHPPTTHRPPSNHPPTTDHRPPTDHPPTTHRPPTDRPPTPHHVSHTVVSLRDGRQHRLSQRSITGVAPQVAEPSSAAIEVVWRADVGDDRVHSERPVEPSADDPSLDRHPVVRHSQYGKTVASAARRAAPWLECVLMSLAGPPAYAR
jgi:hypothetical protein